MLKVRIIIYMVLLAGVVFFLGRSLALKNGKEIESVQMEADLEMKSYHMTISRYLGEITARGKGTAGRKVYSFRVIKYLNYTQASEEGMGRQENFSFNEAELNTDDREAIAGLALDDLVLLGWNELKETIAGATRERVQVIVIKPLSAEERGEFESAEKQAAK